MKTMRIQSLTHITVFGASLGVSSVAHAKIDPGVWARLDRIEIDAELGRAPIVEMHGAFMLADPNGGQEPFVGHGAAERGLVRYECPADQTATCIADWARFAETVGNCIAFGQRTENNGSVRTVDDEGAPDVYVVVDQSDIDLRIWSGECDPNLAAALDAGQEQAASGGHEDAASGCGVARGEPGAYGAWSIAIVGFGWMLRRVRRETGRFR